MRKNSDGEDPCRKLTRALYCEPMSVTFPRVLNLLLAVGVASSCGDALVASDGGGDAAPTTDGGASDANVPDGSAPDAPTGDAGSFGDHAFWFAFHACNSKTTNCGDPQNHRVYLSTTNDFSTFSVLPNWGLQGSVPDVVRRGNTVYVYVPGRVIRLRAGAAAPEAAASVKVVDLSLGWVDPSLTVDSNGRLVMFLMRGGGPGSGDPATCPQGETSCTKQFDSATEVDGSDGTEFKLDTGDRVSMTITPGGGGSFPGASDPDVFFDGKYNMYISHGSNLSLWQSTDLRGTYTQLKATPSDYISQSGGIGAGHFDTKTNKYWTFVHVNEGKTAVIKRAIHDGLTTTIPTSSWSTILTGTTAGLGADFNVESPSLAENK